MQGKKTGGRQLGTVNRLTRSCREAIEFASDALGGAERLAEWAAESPENEGVFWRNIYPRLLPSSVNLLALQQQRDALARPPSREEVIELLEDRVGPEGRRLFEDFMAEVERLEQRLSSRERIELRASPPLLKSIVSA
jgi:hypothetical protein